MERFAKAAFVAADDVTRARLCRDLGALLHERLANEPDFAHGVKSLIAKLRAVGHDLWSYDEDDDFAIWCQDWTKAEAPGVVITFRPTSVHVTWSSATPKLPRYDEPGGTRGVVFEDDGRTMYAYLMDGEKIVSAVWLYNSVPAVDVRWDDPDAMPFPNKPELIDADVQLAIDAGTQIRCEWDTAGVDIFVDEQKVARIENDTSPGWSCTAKLDGPLARRLRRSD